MTVSGSEGRPLEMELESARETIRRLNRRVQLAESALAEKLDEAKRSGGSLGRALSGWAYTATSERLREIGDALHDMKWDDLPAGLHRFRPIEAQYARSMDFTDIRPARVLPDADAPQRERVAPSSSPEPADQ